MDISPVETPWHIFSALFVFLTGLLMSLRISKSLNTKKKIILSLYFWHTFFSFIYLFFTLTAGGDSLGYYRNALRGGGEIGFGTPFIVYLSFILVSYLKLSYLGLFLFFNILGSLGLALFYASLHSISSSSSRKIRIMVLLIVFLPSISFWSSALGKDAISFLAINLALWASLKLDKRKLLMAIAVVLMLVVRPHMAGMLVIALALSIFFGSKNINFAKKILISFMVFPILIVLVPFAGKYAGIEDVSNIQEVSTYMETRQTKNMEGGSSLDITSMPLPVKVFTYLFRPLPYEAHSITSLLSSIDNLILFGFFIYGMRYLKIVRRTFSHYSFLWSYIIIATFFLSSMTANLGIAVRQKWMIMPMLIYLLFVIVVARQERKLSIRLNNNRSIR